MKSSSSNEAAPEADQVPLHQTKRKGRKRKEVDPDERKKKKNERDRNHRAKKKRESQQMRDENRELKTENTELKIRCRIQEELMSLSRTPENHRRREVLEAMMRKLKQKKAETQRMKMELEEDSSITGRVAIEQQERRIALEKEGANVEQMRQIPCAWEVDGNKFTSFEEAETWFASQTYDQGPNDTNINTSAAAGNVFVFASEFDALYNPSTGDPFADHDLAAEFPTLSAAGSSFAAYPESASASDVLESYDVIFGDLFPAAGFSF